MTMSLENSFQRFCKDHLPHNHCMRDSRVLLAVGVHQPFLRTSQVLHENVIALEPSGDNILAKTTRNSSLILQ